ncbi:hypothetical protein PACTADRAFT_48136 [Pachysolen tannophilus NRRL Y-2460]|uniref:ATP synthase subunit epsilon, mitochondrial n=1 Tax=Pachysolen tannophilus NRRL Y-2460 TaxID=669874 RepID=A0A1E4U382_PACTA|nr:hypothetical protein PACTADRAFT_48136 [Pachysolen tannophilus NRRL Y-2460]
MSAWEKAGISFNKYLALSARTVRRSLKQDLRVKAEKRDVTEAQVQTIKDGNITQTKPLGLTK